jgi:hypothetical protein
MLQAKAFGVGGFSVGAATKVMEKAIPEVVKAVDDGRMSVSTAAILSSEPEEVTGMAPPSPLDGCRFRRMAGANRRNHSAIAGVEWDGGGAIRSGP